MLIYILVQGDKKCACVFGELREDNDIKQAVVAKLLNVSQAVYSRYETGARTAPYSVLIDLSKYYDTTVDYLLGISDIKKPYKK